MAEGPCSPDKRWCAMGVRLLGELAWRKGRGERGQMTVELAVVFPVAIAVAAMAVNALLFFGECAAFDRAFPQAVRVYAASPAYGETAVGNAALVQSEMAASFDADYLSVGVSASEEGLGHVRFKGVLDFAPTLFGMGLRSEIFGVSLPHLTHEASYVIDPYKPGVIA